MVQLSKTNQTNEILPPLKALKPCLHAALGASEACSAGTAALVQWRVEALPSAFLPEVQVLAVGACATFHIGFLIFVLFHQSIMVVHVLHATKLVQFQAAVSPGCTWIIRLKSLQSGVHCLSSCQGQGHKGQQKLHGHTATGMRCFQRESWALRAYSSHARKRFHGSGVLKLWMDKKTSVQKQTLGYLHLRILRYKQTTRARKNAPTARNSTISRASSRFNLPTSPKLMQQTWSKSNSEEPLPFLTRHRYVWNGCMWPSGVLVFSWPHGPWTACGVHCALSGRQHSGHCKPSCLDGSLSSHNQCRQRSCRCWCIGSCTCRGSTPPIWPCS